ncbi:RIP metalloprotease RseP [Cohaesibacter gelatinilyticus]|uniref:Zinc metalloprotease n=1 Tax=Cohaesibacter gelatinilyticus TaxID=372072 RepID=A0A285NEI4_9HYPH|nr:RIP metalloprotease RseP [Cohaesibacter gelatinilyticus]SNZ07860.1 site-2 protease. Metallo peptidase. MEROPS family M50B [Cohaesibacter gelatinilyticus]
MEFLEGLFSAGGGLFGYLIPALFVLTIVVFIHELGHFMVGRWCGVTIKAFSVGFGPELFGFYDKHGTRWKFSAIPLGGYVKFLGDENAASVPDQDAISQMSDEDRAGALHTKPLWARAAIVAAGPIANFLLAIVIFAGLLMVYGKAITPARVDSIVPNSAAETAGFEVGDIMIAIDGNEIEAFSDIQRIVALSSESTLQITVDRGGELVTLSTTPRRQEITDQFGNKQKIGVLGIRHQASPEDVRRVAYGPGEALVGGVKETYFIIDRTLGYIGRIFVGKEDADQLGGPIRVAQVSGQVATLGIAALINLAGMLSVSIGLINLFPVPMLDGGHLLFFAIEAVRGKPLSEKNQELGFKIGLAMVLSLMVFATFNDISYVFLSD